VRGFAVPRPFLSQPVNDPFDLSALRAELARKGWTLKKLAEECGLSPSYISVLARGLRPTDKARQRIFRALGPEATKAITSGSRS